jgi:hypothetical protein
VSLALAHPKAPETLAWLGGPVDCMLEAQRPDGAIPWFEDGAWDPWNHAECVMALAIMGESEAVERGWNYLACSQGAHGGWLAGYGSALPMDGPTKLARGPAPSVHDSNFSAYPAVALWRCFKLNGDLAMVRRHWPMVRAAIGFVLDLQSPDGDIAWSLEAYGTDVDDALLAGNASIHKSLECALRLAELVGDPHSHWRAAQARLKQAILCRPDRFDRAGLDRGGFAMDWYYPVLAGVMRPAAALARLESRAPRFIEPGRGCRCVAAEPWATVAETCELAMALVSLGLRRQAASLLDWQLQHRDAAGAFWMGWQFEQGVVWPEERPTWTQAAAILAFDALRQASPGWDVLIKRQD